MVKKHLKCKSYSLNCVAAPPLLFIFNRYIHWLSIVLLTVLIIVLIISLIKRKIKKEKIINNGFKLCVSGIISIILYQVCCIYIVPSDYYPLELLVLLIALLLNLLLAFKCGVIKKRMTIILTIILAIFLIFTCIISVIKVSEGYQLIQEDTRIRNSFQAVLNELPKPSNIEKQVFSDPSVIHYYIPMDTYELVNFYKSNIFSAEWELLLEQGSEYDYKLYYQKTSENVWVSLLFDGSSKDNTILMQGREYPFTYLTIRLYESNPLMLSEDGNWYYIPPVMMNDMMGGCGDFTLY